MPAKSPSLSAAAVSTLHDATPPADTAGFDQRWAVWQAKGAAHDRAVRRRLVLAAPVVAVIGAVVLYALLMF